jgi:hypothetical protein
MYRIGLGIVLVMTACAVDDGSRQPEPIASVELSTGLTVEFFEPAPGSILVVQSARAGVSPVHRSAARAIDFYRELAPTERVPDALVLAQEREDAVLPPTNVARSAVAPAGTGGFVRPIDLGPQVAAYIDNQGCDDHWFDTTFCIGAAYDWDMCLLNHWNGAYAQSGSVSRADYAACADIGDITMKVHMGDGMGGIWDVLEGHYRAYSWTAGSPFFWSLEDTRGDILNATNNRFHYFAGYWD